MQLRHDVSKMTSRQKNIVVFKMILGLTGIGFAEKKAGGIYESEYIFAKLFFARSSLSGGEWFSSRHIPGNL